MRRVAAGVGRILKGLVRGRRGAYLAAAAVALALVSWPAAHRPALAPGAGEAPPEAARLQPAVAVPEGPPAIRSPAAILVDAHSGDILYARNAHERRDPASVTKLMPLLLAMEAVREGRASLEEPVTVSARAAATALPANATLMFLERGDRVPLRELLLGIAVASANDASLAVAEHIGGSVEGFVARMNRKAAELGMRDTLFSNPTGLPDAAPHHTSAYDLAALSRYLVLRHPRVLEWTGMWEHWFQKGRQRFWLTNFNRGLVEYPGMDGLKTGYTEKAGFCLAATARSGDRRLIAVVLGAPTPKVRNEDIYRLLDWGFGGTTTVRLARPGQPLGLLSVLESTRRRVPVEVPDGVAVTVPRGREGTVRSRLEVRSRAPAPVRRGQPVGELVVEVGGKTVRRVPVLAAADAPQAGVLALAGRYWLHLWVPPGRGTL